MLITDRLTVAVDDLRARLTGEIAQSAADVVEVVDFACEHGLRVAPQGTGHNAGPLGSLDDTVLLKTHKMRGVHIDVERKLARVEAGVEWADATKRTSEHLLAPLSGSSPNAGAVFYPLERAPEIVRAWRDWAGAAPDEITTSLRMLNVPPLPDVPEMLRGRSFVVIDGAYLGPEAEAVEVLAPFRALGPEIDLFAPVPPIALSYIHMDPEEPVPGLGDHFMMEALDDEAIDRIVALAGAGSNSPLLVFELRQLGGAFNRPAVDGGALSALDGAYAVFQAGMVMGPEMAVAIEDGFARARAALAPWIGGRPYLNFAERLTEGFHGETTLRRLQAVKADVDPHDVIRANHPITPAA